MFKIFGLVFVFLLSVSTIIFSEEKVLEKKYLIAISLCTEMACNSNNSCCNHCQVSGWRVQMEDVEAKMENGELPDCKVDGCGRCDFLLEASGYYSKENKKDVFWVKSFSVQKNLLVIP